MFRPDPKSRKSIYEQVVDSFKEDIHSGILSPGDRIPSVRDLSKELTINPNTVQKAYRELERAGYCYTVSGLGTFVAKPEKNTVNEERVAELKNLLQSILIELRFQNVTPGEIREMTEELLVKRGDSK